MVYRSITDDDSAVFLRFQTINSVRIVEKAVHQIIPFLKYTKCNQEKQIKIDVEIGGQRGKFIK